jgi:hypothetical protein
VLRPGGRFLTQQRDEAGEDGEAWEELFGRPAEAGPSFDLSFATGQLEEAGFTIERADHAETPMIFRDLLGVIYHLRLSRGRSSASIHGSTAMAWSASSGHSSSTDSCGSAARTC